MSKKTEQIQTEQTEIALAATQAYITPLSVHLFDKDFQYILEAHGERDASGELIEPQDPLKGVAYHSIEDSVEDIVNVVDSVGVNYLFDMPGRSNSLVNAIKADINRTIRMWSRNVKNIHIICPLLNPEKSVSAAEAQALEFQKIVPGAGMARVHFDFVLFPENKHFSTVMNEFKKSDAIQSLSKVGAVNVLLIKPEFNTELPAMIHSDTKAWKLKDLVNENISNFAWDILCEFIDSTSQAWKNLFGKSLQIAMDEKGTLIIFLSAEGGVRKSTLAGSTIEEIRG